MRGTIVKNIKKLVDEKEVFDALKDEKELTTEELNTRSIKIKRLRKKFWNKLSWIEKSKRTAKLRRVETTV